MSTSLTSILGSPAQALTAGYLKDYLNTLSPWPTSTKFSRERFSRWLLNDTHANDAFGCDYLLGGLDELVSNGYVTKNSAGLEMTPAFVDIMQQAGATDIV